MSNGRGVIVNPLNRSREFALRSQKVLKEASFTRPIWAVWDRREISQAGRGSPAAARPRLRAAGPLILENIKTPPFSNALLVASFSRPVMSAASVSGRDPRTASHQVH